MCFFLLFRPFFVVFVSSGKLILCFLLAFQFERIFVGEVAFGEGVEGF